MDTFYSLMPGKEMYIINHGKLECIVTTESGERIVVATLTEGMISVIL